MPALESMSLNVTLPLESAACGHPDFAASRAVLPRVAPVPMSGTHHYAYGRRVGTVSIIALGCRHIAGWQAVEHAGSRSSAVHQREDAPAEVFAPVPRVPGGVGREFGPYLSRQFVVGVVVEPTA